MNNDEDPVIKIDSGVDHSVAVTTQVRHLPFASLNLLTSSAAVAAVTPNIGVNYHQCGLCRIILQLLKPSLVSNSNEQ